VTIAPAVNASQAGRRLVDPEELRRGEQVGAHVQVPRRGLKGTGDSAAELRKRDRGAGWSRWRDTTQNCSLWGDVDAALVARGPSSAHVLRTARRSLFQALRHHRQIFADPTRNLHGKTANRLARPIPSDRLRGLLDRVTTTMGRAAVALVAIHALSIEELRALHLTNLEHSRWRLAIARDQRTHYVVLDDTCIRLVNDWLHERKTRWPATTNPHLFSTRMTATDPRNPPPSRYAIVRHFHPTGLNPTQLRTDRILYEAAQGADPVLIMRLFGVCKTTAMKYVNTAALTRSRDPIGP
jgi:hypothetical protein